MTGAKKLKLDSSINEPEDSSASEFSEQEDERKRKRKKTYYRDRAKMTGAEKIKLDSSFREHEDSSASESSEMEDDRGKKRKKTFHRIRTNIGTDDPSSKVVRHIIKKLQKKQVTKEAVYLSRLAEMERLLKEKEEYQRKILKKKDKKHKLLQNQLIEIKKESEIAKHQVQKAREDAQSSFIKLMEMELQCTICNELFIQATSLNCAHVFCKLCIDKWMKVKKECPNCRTTITSQKKAVALDNYIDRMLDRLSDKMKQQRVNLVKLRKVEQDKFDRSIPGPSILPVASVENASAQRRSRNRTAAARLAAASMRVTSDTD